ncbi:MAG: Ig-like domain-containing protein, partial [Verrucomicrobiota bacterium]
VSAAALVSQTNCPGTTVVFSTVASGTGPFSYAWFKGNTALGETGSSLTLNSVSAENVGVYSVVVSGACGSVTNSANLSVNTPVSATALVSQTNCPGTTVVFSTVASGTGPFSYAWFKGNTALDETGSSLTLNSVSAENAGIYSIIVNGACGSVTNTAILSVNETTTASPLANLVRNPGETAVFSTTVSGTGPFTYAWKKNGEWIGGETQNSLILTNVGAGDEATYTVEVSGACTSTNYSASLHINVAPTVSISNPTNGAVFAFPASFALTANAQDLDGTVTNVEFFRDDILLGQTTDGNPYVLSLTNLVPGTYTFTAKATDNGGLSSTSAPVSITVIDQLPLVLQGALKFNPQTGLYEQKVRVSNPTVSIIDGIRLYIYGLNSSTTVYNATGSTNGVPYVQSLTAIPAGGYLDLVIEYHLTTSGTPNPTLVAVIVPANNGGNTTVLGLGVNINRSLMKPDGTFLLEFATQVGGKYFIQYSSDLKTWKTVDAPVDGTGTKVIWLDNGQPKTESLPSAAAMRFYRVIVTP